MSNEVSKNLVCIVIRNGIHIWIEADRAETLRQVLHSANEHKFIEFDERFINTADLTGIFTPQDLAELTRRKNGEWQCKHGKWWNKGQSQCECSSMERYKTFEGYGNEGGK